jgi:hypothetical protein
MSDFKPMTLYVVQYRYINGNRRWKQCTSTANAELAKDYLAFMLKHADAPCEGRIITWPKKGN